MKKCLFVYCLILSASVLFGGDWPHWRGPQMNGDAGPVPLPTQWQSGVAGERGIAWKTPIPEYGRNTPVVVGDAIFFTSHVDDRDLVLVRVSKTTGEVVWTRKLGESAAPRISQGKPMRTWQKFHEHQNLASPSCVADSDVVVATFGTGSMTVCRHNGDVIWRSDLQKEFGEFVIWWGYANTPLLVDNLIVTVLMHDNLADMNDQTPRASGLIAFDKATGKVVWRTDRTTKSGDEYNDAYTSPVTWNRNGDREILVLGSEMLDAYEPQTGTRIWSIRGLEGNRIVPTPLPCEELSMVFGVRGKRGPIFGTSIPRIGDGGSLNEDAVVWQYEKNPPDVSSMVYHNGALFATDDQGMATCFDAKTGNVHWRERLAAGQYFPSLMVAGGNVYYTSNGGIFTVVKASTKFERVAENKIEDDEFFASPVVADGKIYLRGRKVLYCVGSK